MIFGNILLHRRDDRALRAVSPQRRLEGAHRRPPVGIRTSVGAREVQHQHVEIETAGDDRREGRRHRRLVVPDEGVVVERVGDRYKRPERILHARLVPGFQRRETNAPAFGRVSHHRCLAARATHRREPEAGKRADRVEKLQHLQEGRYRVHPRYAEPLQEGVRGRIRPRQRGSVRDRRRAGLFGAPDLHRNDRLFELPRSRRKPFEAGYGIKTFDVQPEG